MSEMTTRNATQNFIAADTTRQKAFIFNNEFEIGSLLNATAGALTYKVGTLLGRVAASNELVPLTSAAVDGSALPVGILAEEVTLAAGASTDVNFCISGDVDSGVLILQGADALTTVVDLKTINDRIKSDTQGIRLVAVTDGTFYDN